MSRVFLAAGHYPTRPGACWEGFCEHDEAVLWVEAIHDAMPETSLIVPTGTLRQKADFINARLTNGDIAIEIHFNSAKVDGKNIGNGCETLNFPNSIKGQVLAMQCQISMSEFFLPDRGCKDGWYRGDPARGAYFFLERTKCPAVILEPQFIHHKEEIQNKRSTCCTSLASALSHYLGGED